MAENYEVGKGYYLPVTVITTDARSSVNPIGIEYVYTCNGKKGAMFLCDEPDLLLTATEIAENVLGRRCEECLPVHNEVIAEREKLRAENESLRSQVSKNLAEIQNLTSEVHFHKEFGEGIDKQQKELQARYDELDSVNHEQAEKIRRQDKALTDLKQQNDKLQAENTNLTFLLEDKPEKEAARRVHVITNNGKEYVFRRCTKASFDNYGNFTVLKLYEGVTCVGGFLRGDSPDNFAAWWTE